MFRPADPQQWSERQDDRDLVLGDLAAAGRPGAVVVVAAVPAHDPREQRVWSALGLFESP
jgi:hypothetical protein